MLELRPSFPQTPAVSLHSLIDALCTLMSSHTSGSQPADVSLHTLQLLQATLLAFVANKRVVRAETNDAWLAAIKGYADLLDTVADEHKKNATAMMSHAHEASQLQCVVPLLQYRTSSVLACVQLLSDSTRIDYLGLGLAVVQTAVAFFGFGDSGAGTLVSTAATAIKNRIKYQYSNLLYKPLLAMWADSVASPTLEHVQQVMRTHGLALRDPPIQCRWEVTIAYMEMLHQLLQASHAASSKGVVPTAEDGQAVRWMLDGSDASSSSSSVSDPLAGLSSAVRFGQASRSASLKRSAWRPVEFLAFICHCMVLHPASHSAAALPWAKQQLTQLNVLATKLKSAELSATLDGRATIRSLGSTVWTRRTEAIDQVHSGVQLLLDAFKAAHPDEAIRLAAKCPLVPFANDLFESQQRYVAGTRLTIFHAFEEWSQAACSSADDKGRVFWLKSDPGIGKSVFASQVVKQFGSILLATHIIKFSSEPSRTANGLVRSIAHQLAAVLPEYRQKLLGEVLPGVVATELDGMKTGELWNWPLHCKHVIRLEVLSLLLSAVRLVV